MRLDGKKEGARQAMSWLHTWVSVLLGWLMYAIFVTGTLSFFQGEITLWMQPEKHFSISANQTPTQQVNIAVNQLQKLAPDAVAWHINLPDARRQTINVVVKEPGDDPNSRRGGKQLVFDSQTGAQIQARETRGGNFLYRFHFELYGIDRIWGRWIIGLATLFMFVAIISGIITHKKIFTDFFTFRPGKGQRSWLDAHNATAVFTLPFLIMITFSGLLLLMYQYMPWSMESNYAGGRQEYFAALDGKKLTPAELEKLRQQAKNHGQPVANKEKKNDMPAIPTAKMADIGAMVQQAQQQWGENPAITVLVFSPNTIKAEVEVRAQNNPDLTDRGGIPSLKFNGVTGQQLDKKPQDSVAPISWVTSVYNFFSLLHQAKGVDAALRWLLFASGLFGTMMIASGLVLWIVKRTPEVQKLGYKPFGHRLVEVLNVAAIMGLPLACLSYIWSSRFVPLDIAQRAEAEIKVFFIVWLLALIHATIRPYRRAWLEQLALATAMFLFTPILNVITGGQPLWASLYYQQWVVASFDIICLILGLLFAYTYYKLNRYQGAAKKPAGKHNKISNKTAAESTNKISSTPQSEQEQ